MSVLSRPRLHHSVTDRTTERAPDAPMTTTSTPTVPTQRGADTLRPWSPKAPGGWRVGTRRRRTVALGLAGLAIVGGAATGIVLAVGDDDPVTTRIAPVTSVDAPTTTDLSRDAALSERGRDATRATDAQRDAVLSTRGGLQE